MSKKKTDRSGQRPRVVEVLGLSGTGSEPVKAIEAVPGASSRVGLAASIGKYRYALGAVGISLLIGLGVMASNGWLPSTDPLSGKKTGWFGKVLPQGASSSWNPFAPPPPSPTPPPLVKEYIYAGSKLLAVEDKNANAPAVADLAIWRKSTGIWYVLTSAEGVKQTQITFQWGLTTDVPAVGRL